MTDSLMIRKCSGNGLPCSGTAFLQETPVESATSKHWPKWAPRLTQALCLVRAKKKATNFLER